MRLYSERRGLGLRHKPHARVYADTKSCLVPNYFVVGITAIFRNLLLGVFILTAPALCAQQTIDTSPPPDITRRTGSLLTSIYTDD